jgi:hypothetical protein
MAGLIPEGSGGLADAIDRILDKGLVINADISVSVAGTELLGIKIRASLASFETAARYGMDFPSGTNLNAAGWREADKTKASCPACGNRREERLLIEEGCHICGWASPMRIKALEHMA